MKIGLKLAGVPWVSGLLLLAISFLAGCKTQTQGAKYLGQRLAIQFEAIDGRQVDLTKMRGKVVLVDFWATWCPPCVKEVPEVKAAYDKLHERGFEVVGISRDEKMEDLRDFVAKNKIEWPQYLDGIEGRFATKFGVEEIPAMWLLDKQGKVRDVEATENLIEKAEKLLAEPSP